MKLNPTMLQKLPLKQNFFKVIFQVALDEFMNFYTNSRRSGVIFLKLSNIIFSSSQDGIHLMEFMGTGLMGDGIYLNTLKLYNRMHKNICN